MPTLSRAPRTTSSRPTGGLFFTIFLWFFAAQLLIGVALYALAAATERRFESDFTSMAGGYIAARAQATAVAYETGGPQAAQRAWQFSDAPPNRGRGGGPRGGRGPDNDRGPEVRSSSALFVVRGAAEAPQLLAGPAPAISPSQLALAARAVPDDSSAQTFAGENGTLWLAQRVQTARGQYLGVMQLNPRGGPGGPRGGNSFWRGLLGGGPSSDGPWWHQLMRWAVIVTLMGALCFGLARYLTTPALTLSSAARRFAEGDLSARVGPQLSGRHDELGALGRDFDFMAERIETQRAAERRLLGDISHELRSPLARLQVALDLAEQGADAQTRTYLARIEEEVEELGTLIGQLLTLTRLENASADALGGETVDLAALVSQVCADADFEASASGRTVELAPTEAASVYGNASLLHSAIENVVRNALIHAPQSSQVQVSLQTQANQAVIRVRDWGQGVPAEALDQLFAPFYRVAQARDRQSGGTGLGLSITQRALASHGGSVKASNAPGGGLEVEMRLPLLP